MYNILLQSQCFVLFCCSLYSFSCVNKTELFLSQIYTSLPQVWFWTACEQRVQKTVLYVMYIFCLWSGLFKYLLLFLFCFFIVMCATSLTLRYIFSSILMPVVAADIMRRALRETKVGLLKEVLFSGNSETQKDLMKTQIRCSLALFKLTPIAYLYPPEQTHPPFLSLWPLTVQMKNVLMKNGHVVFGCKSNLYLVGLLRVVLNTYCRVI